MIKVGLFVQIKPVYVPAEHSIPINVVLLWMEIPDFEIFVCAAPLLTYLSCSCKVMFMHLPKNELLFVAWIILFLAAI